MSVKFEEMEKFAAGTNGLLNEMRQRVEETLLLSEKQFKTMEKIFDRKKPRSRRTNQLETEKAQKEAEVQKAMEENVRLHAMVDKKDVQLQVMNDERAVQVHGFEPSKLVEERHTR